MSVKVKIPTPLQKLTKDQAEVAVAGETVSALIQNLEKSYPGIQERLCDEKGKLRRFVNVYVNEEDIRFLKGEETPLKEGDEVSIIPAIAGGSRPRGPAATLSQISKIRLHWRSRRIWEP